MIDDKHKFIFIHIPKTGGTSILNFFKSDDMNSVSSHWRKYDASEYTDYFKFTFVRNPYDKFVSEYEWRNKQKHYHRRHYDIQGNISFKECCNKLLQGKLDSMYPQMEKIHLWSQHKLLEHALDSCDDLNYIGRFENLQEDFNIICAKIGIPHRKLPHINKSKRKHYTEYYDDETRQIITDIYAKDIKYFKYKFGE